MLLWNGLRLSSNLRCAGQPRNRIILESLNLIRSRNWRCRDVWSYLWQGPQPKISFLSSSATIADYLIPTSPNRKVFTFGRPLLFTFVRNCFVIIRGLNAKKVNYALIKLTLRAANLKSKKFYKLIGVPFKMGCVRDYCVGWHAQSQISSFCTFTKCFFC